ncbi:MAG: hypothetical protein ABIX36_17130 [Mucilaginibacter sp.]|jgi:hypothetical protein|uniref:hypothetical protein n=1 Tax=Mucilaginibacter sp. TaxID=1882438 RepID=UPI003266D5AC
MRKNFLGIAAIVIALGASAFTAPNRSHGKLVTYKWFQITANRTTDQSVPSSGATYLGESEMPPTGDGCNNLSNKQCVSGFSAGQVTSTNHLDGPQIPEAIAATRN